MSQRTTLEELRHNLDILDFDEWEDGILHLATKLRASGGEKATDIVQFEGSIYRVTVEKIDTIED